MRTLWLEWCLVSDLGLIFLWRPRGGGFLPGLERASSWNILLPPQRNWEATSDPQVLFGFLPHVSCVYGEVPWVFSKVSQGWRISGEPATSGPSFPQALGSGILRITVSWRFHASFWAMRRRSSLVLDSPAFLEFPFPKTWDKSQDRAFPQRTLGI